MSRVLYAEEVEASIDSSGISSVAVPKHYIYEFPDGVEELDDHNLFIITDHVNFDSGFHDAVVAALKAEYADISVDALRAMAADATNVSLLANMVRVVCAAGLWELNVKFVAAPDGSVVAFLTHMERPAFGGGEPVKFFHKDREGEVMSNVRVGLEWVADWLKSPEAAAASE